MAALNITQLDYLYRLIRDGILKARKVEGRWRIDAASVAERKRRAELKRRARRTLDADSKSAERRTREVPASRERGDVRTTPGQREAYLDAIDGGGTRQEAEGAARAPFAEDDLSRGARDVQSGVLSDQADLFQEYLQTRATARLRLKALIEAEAGDRSSADYLRLLEALNPEPEVAVAGSESSHPNAAVVLVESNDPEVRAAAQASLDASRNLLRVLTANDDTTRPMRAVTA
jgi:hypothetical protein